ncbi:DUF4394 domain-containing protein [Solicola sp. PLA-1-18]|uniref:DUF4394 domain-containing protein n=1 Tax=Solicola sp. PLA-1-18 TaxID=3380532 RepID=UPI003B82A611
MSTTRSLTVLAVAGAMLAAVAPAALAVEAPTPLDPAVRVVGLTTTGGITSIDTGRQKASRTKAVKGLRRGDTVVGIDYRPANDKLYGVVQGAKDTLRVVKISPRTGRTYTSRTLHGADGRAITSTATAFGADFDPVTGLLRVVNEERGNYRVDVDTGRTVVDGTLDFARGAQYEGRVPRVPAVAHTHSVKGATQTTAYALEATTDTVARLDPADAGDLTVQAFTIDVRGKTGFDIATSGSTDVVLMSNTSGNQSKIYRLQLADGAVLSKSTIRGKRLLDVAAPTGR